MNQEALFDESGAELRDRGMKKAIDHAEQETPNWGDLAFDQLKEFTSMFPDLEFMAEDFREYAVLRDLPIPPHNRAFGSVMARAARAGLIVKVRYGQVQNPKAHRANAAVWRKAP